jgi:hypothetical protein
LHGSIALHEVTLQHDESGIDSIDFEEDLQFGDNPLYIVVIATIEDAADVAFD